MRYNKMMKQPNDTPISAYSVFGRFIILQTVMTKMLKVPSTPVKQRFVTVYNSRIETARFMLLMKNWIKKPNDLRLPCQKHLFFRQNEQEKLLTFINQSL